jgi:hypothetical protein
MAAMPIEDHVLREYLLGRLDQDSRDRVEDRLFSDDQLFWEHLCLVEDELISDFARGALSGEDRAAFLERFACTEERRSKVAFARALQAYVEDRQPQPAAAWGWLRQSFGRPAWAAAAAGLALVVLAGTLMQRTAIAPDAPRVVAVALSSGLTRGAGELVRVRVSPDVELVRFELDRGSDRHAAYRAAVHAVTGEEIWSQATLTPDSGTADPLVITVPGALLSEGDYYVRLEGLSPGSEAVPLPRYDFRVLRD